MDSALTDRVSSFAPPWLRYMLTLSEAVRTKDTWVVASGEDIALWDTDAGAVLPMWPSEPLAAEVAEGQAKAAPVAVGELSERLLPFLLGADASVGLFPNFDDDMLVEPAAVIEDLADFIAEPVDIVGQLGEPPVKAVYDEWALLEAPVVDEEQSEDWTPVDVSVVLSGERYADALAAAAATGALWMLDDPAEEAIVGVVLDDRPALALFTSAEQASEYGERTDAEVTPKAVGVEALVRGWLLFAYGVQWSVALSPEASDALFVEPTRFALDLAEACAVE